MAEKETHLRLQPALQEVFDLEAENVVKLHSVVAEDASPVKSPLYICLFHIHEQDMPDEPPEERVALEEPAGILLLQGEQLTSGGPDQGQAVLHTPHLERMNIKQSQDPGSQSPAHLGNLNSVIVASVRDHSQ